MNNILHLLQKYSTFIVFVFLEIFCSILIFNNNNYHKAAFINKSNAFSNSYNNSVSKTVAYFNLTNVNDSLAKMNANLLKKIAGIPVDTSPKLDSNSVLKSNPQFDFITARVIKNSISNSRNYIYINRGALDGVEKDMGVISENGPVGVVVNVTDHYAVIMSFLHKQSHISTKLKNTNYFGQLSWKGGNSRLAILEEIPKHVKVKIGDTLITSGHSTYFPEGIEIGVIAKFVNNSESNYAEAKVLLKNDFANLNYLYVIVNHQKKNIQELENIESKLNTENE